MKQRTAAQLARIERQSLDRLRQELARIDAELASLHSHERRASHDLADAYGQCGRELPLDIANGLTGGLGLRRAELRERAGQLADTRATVHEQLIQQLLEVKRWEMAGTRLARREALARSRAELAGLDEAARNRRARR